MSKNRKSNKESKKKPVLTMMEKRAAKKTKNQDDVFLNLNNTAPNAKTGAGVKRS